MKMKLGRTVSVLAGVLVAAGLGACASLERADNPRHQSAALETRTDLTMADLAGEWVFDAAEAEAAVVEQVQAGLEDIDDPAQREQARSMMQEMTQPAIDLLTSVTVTLQPDGELRSTSVDVDGTEEAFDGSWTLDAGIVTFIVQQPGRYDDQVSAARVIDAETMEINMDESGDAPMFLLLRKRS